MLASVALKVKSELLYLAAVHHIIHEMSILDLRYKDAKP